MLEKVYFSTPQDASASFRRDRISKVAGGGGQGLICRVRENHPRYGIYGGTTLLHYQGLLNPYAPTRPGEHGVLFAAPHKAADFRELERTPTTVPVFRCLGPTKWQYLGTYEFTPTSSLTGEEWAQLSAEVGTVLLALIDSCYVVNSANRLERTGSTSHGRKERLNGIWQSMLPYPIEAMR